MEGKYVKKNEGINNRTGNNFSFITSCGICRGFRTCSNYNRRRC